MFIGISEDKRFSDAQAQIEAYSLTFPIVQDHDGVLAARFRVREMPMTFVVDRHWRVRWVGGPDQGGSLATAVASVQ